MSAISWDDDLFADDEPPPPSGRPDWLPLVGDRVDLKTALVILDAYQPMIAAMVNASAYTIRKRHADAAITVHSWTAADHAVEKRRSRLFAAGVLTERGRPAALRRNTWTADEDAIVIETIHQALREVAERLPAHTPEAVRLRRRGLRNCGLIPPSNRRRHSPRDS